MMHSSDVRDLPDENFEYETEWIDLGTGASKFVHAWSDRRWGDGESTSTETPARDSRATVVIVHGLGEHGGRYGRLAQDFVAAGFRVVSFDQQGHGRSSEPRGCVASYDSLLDDIGAFLQWATDTYPQPAVLFGHSMGGNLVLNYILRRSRLPAAAISSSPMIVAVRQPGFLYRILARTLRMIAPDYRLESKLIPERLMSDPLEQQAILDDKLFHTRLSLRLAVALFDSGAWALANACRLSIPTLLTHGTDDCLTSHEASAAFAARCEANCQLEILDAELHDPFRGLERARIIGIFIRFINQFAGQAVN